MQGFSRVEDESNSELGVEFSDSILNKQSEKVQTKGLDQKWKEKRERYLLGKGNEVKGSLFIIHKVSEGRNVSTKHLHYKK